MQRIALARRHATAKEPTVRRRRERWVGDTKPKSVLQIMAKRPETDA